MTLVDDAPVFYLHSASLNLLTKAEQILSYYLNEKGYEVLSSLGMTSQTFLGRFSITFKSRTRDFTLFSKASDTSKTFIVAKQLILRNPGWLHLKANKLPFFHVKFHKTGSGSLAST